MAQISKILHKQDREKYWVYVDGEFCVSIRERTFKGMNLREGMEISCDKLKEMESFHFKNQYQNSWEEEKVRLKAVTDLLHDISPEIKVTVTGFGADSNELIREHPEEQGKPDLEVTFNSNVIMLVEVSGTKVMRGSDYWVRPDKLSYCQHHPEENVWIVLHYAEPSEKFVFIKPRPEKEYLYEVKNIRGTDEHYVVFTDDSPEVYSRYNFAEQLLGLLD
ncbi:hypothetical protein DEU29_11548 [Idiomarina aquatica]|uniref:Uncharacterized protein n=1 Tax=Idiomarina aquatica TaxID=1327752 RepID=A0A4R6P0R2_9GAMM|nr:hypothetical protein [Idiomarina aquatica]TDP30765.1 hypothetical protein DEU29_11548 [Idiomarina aquatica]